MGVSKTKTGRLGRINQPGISQIAAILNTLEVVCSEDIDDVEFLRSLVKSVIDSQREALVKNGYNG